MPDLGDDPFQPNAAHESEENGIQIAEYLQMVRRHWPLVVTVVVLCLTGFALRYSLTPKQYQATAQIQIERRSLSSLTGGQNPMNTWLENWWNLEYYPTQYRLLQSRGLAERVVANLRLAENPEFNPAAQPGTTQQDATPTARDDDAALGGLAMKLLGGLEVSPVKGTQLVLLSYRSHSPELAAAIPNGVAEAFIDWGIEQRATRVGEASRFLDDQINALKEEIASKENALQELSRKSGLVTLDSETSVIVSRLEALNQDYIAAKGERISKEAAYNELLNSPKESVAETVSGGVVERTRSQLLELEQDYASKLSTYKPEFPDMVELKARIDQGKTNLESLIDETVEQALGKARAEYQTALRKEQALARELQSLRDENLDQRSAALEYSNLLIEISTRRSLLNEMLRSSSETAVTSRLQKSRESNVRIVDHALTPSTPYRPSLRRELSLGLGMGLVLGIGLALLIELLDRTVKDTDELEKLLGLPTLASVPDISEGAKGRGYGYGYGYGSERRSEARRKRRRGERHGDEQQKLAIELLPHRRPRLLTSEAYRALRTALLLSTAEELKAVSVTSADSGEGKTTTAVNLAVVMAQLGRLVLLLDADLRKPRLHEIFRVSNRFGLVNLLTGSDTDPKQAILATEVPNLFVLPAGPLPPNPAELLASERMRQFVSQVRSRFDFVVIDTTPALAVTDATVVGSLADGVLLCAQAHRLLREDAKACRNQLQRADVRILGTVLNRYRHTGSGYGKRYYAYEASDDDEPAAEAVQDSAA